MQMEVDYGVNNMSGTPLRNVSSNGTQPSSEEI